MQTLKRKRNTGVKPELTRRYTEKRACCTYLLNNKSENSFGPINIQNINKNQPMLHDVCEPQYNGWKAEHFLIKLDKANCCVKMKTGGNSFGRKYCN